MAPSISCIAVDLDGTLLNSNHQISPKTRASVDRARAAGVEVVIATGKTRSSSTHLIKELGLTSAGVYSQGLTIANADGSVRHEQHMDDQLIREAAEAAVEHGCSFVIYKDIDLFTSTNDRWTVTMLKFDQPLPIETGTVQELMRRGPFQKVILLQEPAHLKTIRPILEKRFAGRASLMMSQSYMLEIVPLGSSKGDGLRRLLDDMSLTYENVIAFGDGENDLEMIRWAKIGVAMGNAMPRVKAEADFVTKTNDQDGIPFALDRFLFKK